MSKQITLKDHSPADLDRLAAELARRENLKESTGAMNELLRQGRGGPKYYTDGREVPPIGPRRIGQE